MTDLSRLGMEISRCAEKIEQEIGKEHGSLATILQLLERMRSASSRALLRNVEAALETHVADKLWSSHLKTNTKFRSDLRQLRDGGNTETADGRKLRRDYLNFLRTSQKHYRCYIGDLVAAYGGLPALEKAAQKLRCQEPKEVSSQQVPRSTQTKALESCYQALVQLGDLSRYRATEISDRYPDWSHATGYYDLAQSVLPSSGLAHNQLAVVALAENNLFRAMYFLFRSLATQEPPQQTEWNLKKAFTIVSQFHGKGKLIRDGATRESGPSSALKGWHLLLVWKCYKGEPFGEHDELETEVISHLVAELNSQGQSKTLRRLVLVNIAAGYCGQVTFTATQSQEARQSYVYFLCLNIRTSLALLRVLEGEANKMKSSTDGEVNLETYELSTTLEKALPEIRLYSSWLLKNDLIMANSTVYPVVNALQSRYWTQMASCLSLVAEVFPAQYLPELDYLLEEDADTIAFGPLDCEETREIWYVDGKLKPEWFTIPEALRSKRQEMLSRVRQFLKVGIMLTFKENAPLGFDHDKAAFYYKGDRNQDTSPSAMEGVINTQALQNPDVTRSTQPGGDDNAHSHQSEDQDAEAERMVSGLVDVEQSGPALDPSKSVESLPERNSPETPHGVAVLPASNSSWTATTKGSDLTSSSYPVGTDTGNEILAAARSFSQQNEDSDILGQPPRRASPSLAPGAERPRPQSNRLSPIHNGPAQGFQQPSYAAMLASRNGAHPAPSAARPASSNTSNASHIVAPRPIPRPSSGQMRGSPQATSMRSPSGQFRDSLVAKARASHSRVPSAESATSQPRNAQLLNANAQSFLPHNNPWSSEMSQNPSLQSSSAKRISRNNWNFPSTDSASASAALQPATPSTRAGLGLGNGTFDTETPATATTHYGSSIWSPQLVASENGGGGGGGGWQAARTYRGAGKRSGSGSPAFGHASGSNGGLGSRPSTGERDLSADDWRKNAGPLSQPKGGHMKGKNSR